MLTKRKKLSKKQIKEDKLVTFYYKAYGYYEENKSKVFSYIGGFLVLIAVIAFYINHRHQQNIKAGIELSRVMTLYDSGSFLEAIEGRAGTNIIGLKKIVDEYGSTENGETAKIFLADSYNMLGKYDDAFKYYKDYSGSIDMYKATALAGQAGYYANKNDYEKAAGLYRKASRVSKNDVLNPGYILQAGINYLSAGKVNDAKEMFKSIAKDYLTTPEYREANKYLAEVQ
ncbi:MAG: tetratricopeptide repeat protein [Ignavibacteriaceae bacterium]